MLVRGLALRNACHARTFADGCTQARMAFV